MRVSFLNSTQSFPLLLIVLSIPDAHEAGNISHGTGGMTFSPKKLGRNGRWGALLTPKCLWKLCGFSDTYGIPFSPQKSWQSLDVKESFLKQIELGIYDDCIFKGQLETHIISFQPCNLVKHVFFHQPWEQCICITSRRILMKCIMSDT